jgi:hypothetical protein
MNTKIHFEFGGKSYEVGMDAATMNLPIKLPDGRVLHVGQWLESLPPRPLGLTFRNEPLCAEATEIEGAKNQTTGPMTFKALKSLPSWRSTLRMLARKGKTIMVAEGEACMGRYSAIVLNGHGFQLEHGKSGMTAAFSKPDTTHKPIRSIKKVVEMALCMSSPESEVDPPGPTESELVANLLREIEKIRKAD